MGDAARDAYVVVEGMIEVRRVAHAATRGVLRPGSVFGHVEVDSPRDHSAIALGPTWLLAIDRDAARALGLHALFAPTATAKSGDADAYRVEVARSLLVIDVAACVQCGHCAWSCGSAHADGHARLERRGDVLGALASGRERAVLLATSCQHCADAACIPACPTGALARGPAGDVALRADLCTGCGACAKACPWGAVKMAPRAGGADVAIKCDLCRGAGGRAGPACVDACPTGALARVEPRGEAALTPPAPLPAWPFVILGAAAGLAASSVASRWESGALAGAAFAGLAALSVWKRVVRRSGRIAYVVHLALAPLAAGALAAHVGRVPANAAGALAVTALCAWVSGGTLALAYAVVPPRLARLAHEGLLPEDLEARARDLDAHGFAELTGRSESAKAVYTRILAPYGQSRAGTLYAAMLGMDGAQERARLRARVVAILGPRADDVDGLDALIRHVVAVRALGVERLLRRVLGLFVAPHVIAASVAVALLIVHVAIVTWFR
jgi:Fe-S-cluster-containing dehydrogenase component